MFFFDKTEEEINIEKGRDIKFLFLLDNVHHLLNDKERQEKKMI